MIIKRMTATFGNLDNATLSPNAGLNIFYAPNESGKSTWAAFLFTMFYGIGTERRGSGKLPAKDRYKPWSGKPMQGTVELFWQGRNITLQRKSDGRTPMADFLAYDTDTGETLPFLTGENCGKVLLGVESSVFTRSAFIGQGAMSVSQDADLLQRLSALVTTGDETVNYTKTEKRLREWKNHVRHNKTGYLPDAMESLSAVETALDTIHQYHREDLQLNANRKALLKRQEELFYIEKNLIAQETMHKRQRLISAQEAVSAAEEKYTHLQSRTKHLPSLEDLQSLQKELSALPVRQEMSKQMTPPTAPQEPECLPVFRGKGPEVAVEVAAQDASKIQEAPKAVKTLPLYLLAAALLILAFPAWILMNLLAVIPAALSIILVVVNLLRVSRHQKNLLAVEEHNRAILAKYGAQSKEDILTAAVRYGESRQNYLLQVAEYEKALSFFGETAEALEKDTQTLLAKVRGFAPSIYTLDDAVNAVKLAQEQFAALKQAELTLENAKTTWETLRQTLGEVSQAQGPEKDFSLTHNLPQVQSEIAALRQELHSLETTLAQHQGQVQSLGDPAALEAEKQALEEKIRHLTLRQEALSLALETLFNANQSLQSRFSPQVSQLAAQLFYRMTGGKYDFVRLTEDLSMEIRQKGESVICSQLSLSSGTLEQLYLSLRLAICHLVLGDESPLILDDALVFFDDERMAQVLELLKDESEHRQILLFTCHKRELEYLAES